MAGQSKKSMMPTSAEHLDKVFIFNHNTVKASQGVVANLRHSCCCKLFVSLKTLKGHHWCTVLIKMSVHKKSIMKFEPLIVEGETPSSSWGNSYKGTEHVFKVLVI